VTCAPLIATHDEACTCGYTKRREHLEIVAQRGPLRRMYALPRGRATTKSLSAHGESFARGP
jgi:hypothetical protein